MLLHDAEEFDDDLGRWTDEDLSLSGLLGIVDGIERIVEDRRLYHDFGLRFSDRELEMRYLRKLDVSLHGL